MSDQKLTFTYLLGAGASKESIPTVKEIPQGLEDFYVEIVSVISNPAPLYNKNDYTTLRDLIGEIKGVIGKMKSFDTYAKKLWLSNEIAKYDLYRKAFAAFIYYRRLKMPADPRYDLLFASLLEKSDGNVIIPENVNIISWNYDQLVEVSLCHLLQINSTELSQRVNIYSNYTDIQQTTKDNRFCIVKLNGTAGKKFEYDEISVKSTSHEQPIVVSREIIKKVNDYFTFLTMGSGHKLEIDFSWAENNSHITNARKTAMNIMKKTDHLIVVGYSFPTFNRSVDFELLKSKKPGSTIHLQIPEEHINQVKQRLVALTGINEKNSKIKLYTEVDEFHIPFEFNIITKSGPSILAVY